MACGPGEADVYTPTLHRGGHPLPVSVCCVADKQARLVAAIENQLIANGRHREALQCDCPVKFLEAQPQELVTHDARASIAKEQFEEHKSLQSAWRAGCPEPCALSRGRLLQWQRDCL